MHPLFQTPAGQPDNNAEVGQGSGKKPDNGEADKKASSCTKTNRRQKMVKRPLKKTVPMESPVRSVRINLQTRAVAGSGTLRGAKTPFESLAGTRCMNRWDEGSWDTIPIDTEGSPS